MALHLAKNSKRAYKQAHDLVGLAAANKLQMQLADEQDAGHASAAAAAAAAASAPAPGAMPSFSDLSNMLDQRRSVSCCRATDVC